MIVLILQIMIAVGFLMGILGCVKSKRDEFKGITYPPARWTNYRQWDTGLKITSVGVVLWLLGLILKANL